MKHFGAIALFAAMVMSTGCIYSATGPVSGQKYTWWGADEQYAAYLQEVRRFHVDQHPDWPEELKEIIVEGRLAVTMTEEMAMIAWFPYSLEGSVNVMNQKGTGRPPVRINRTVTANGTREQWVYRRTSTSRPTYLYFDDGVLTAIQN